MADKKDDKKKLTSRLNAIKGYLEHKQQKVQQDLNNTGDNFFDSGNKITHKLGAIGNDSAKKYTNGNPFEELVDFLAHSITDGKLSASNFPTKNFLRAAALQSMVKVGTNLNDYVRKEFLRGLEVSTQLGCGVDSNIPISNIRIKPEEFDILEMLKIDPTSKLGTFIYEPRAFNVDPQALNRMFFSTFAGGVSDVYSVNGSLMFSITWDTSTQEYIIANILNKNVYNLITEYFVTVKLFDHKNLYAFLLALLTGKLSKQQKTTYVQNLNATNNVVEKSFAYCQDKNTDDLKSDNLKEFEDLPFEVSDLFQFDDEEGLFKEEDFNRLNGVMKYVDCGNLEIPTDVQRNEDFMDDFIRNEDNGNLDKHVDNLLNDISGNVFQQSAGSIPLEIVKNNTNKNFIKFLPKALAQLIMTPKALFPFILLRRISGNAPQTGVKMLKFIYKIIFRIIRRIFSEYVTEFFRLVKKEIVRLVTIIMADALRELGVKKTTIIKQLINVFKLLSKVGLNTSSCNGLLQSLSNILQGQLHLPFNIPTPLLIGATQRSGFSNVRAFINVVEELDKVGIPTGDLYGQPNKHIIQHLAHIRGVERERDENSVINSTIISGTVVTPAGPGTFVPGTVKIVGIIG
jgi:hypothetical protein